MRNDDAHDWRRNGCVFFADAPDFEKFSLSRQIFNGTAASQLQRCTDDVLNNVERQAIKIAELYAAVLNIKPLPSTDTCCCRLCTCGFCSIYSALSCSNAGKLSTVG